MADINFGSWNDVTGAYGQAVTNALQQQNIPLSQVGNYLSTNFPNSLSGYAPTSAGTTSGYSGGSDPGQINFSGGGGGGLSLAQQIGLQGLLSGASRPPPAPTTSSEIINDPLYNLTKIGAAATQQPMVVNPNPSNQPINQQGGVYSGAQTPVIGAFQPLPGGPNYPKGVYSQVPGIMGGQAPITPPTGAAPFTGTNALPYPGGVSTNQGRAFAKPPMVQPPTIQPPAAPTSPYGANTPGIHMPPPPFAYTAGESITPSTGGMALAAANPPKTLQSGGSVTGKDTDTVPAMLTPGEYVINRNAVQNIGKDKLDQLNKAGKKKKPSLGDGFLGSLGEPTHMQGGGEVPDVTGAAQNYAYQQLTPAEQQLLLQSQAGGNTQDPQAIQLQKKVSGLVNQYISGNPASGTGPAPNPALIAQGMFASGYRPGTPGPPIPQGQPQANPMQIGPPTPSPAQQAAMANQPPPPVPANQPTSAQLGALTNSPAGQWANMTPQQKGEMGIASGLSNIGQAWSNAAQNIANENWKPQQAGSWANPNQYENQEYLQYQRYHQQMQEMMI